jgi:hypothetical protein
MKNSKNHTNKIYTTEIVEIDDGTGDFMMILPEEIMNYNNWKEGQAIEMKYEGGKLYLKSLPEPGVA